MDFTTPLQILAYNELKKMILEDYFIPETIYSERKTSELLGLSRTPVRDAIQRLSQEGYLDVIPSKGFILHKMTEKDLTDTYQIRCALEGYCAVHLANTHNEPETKRIFHILESLVRDMDSIASTTGNIEDFEHYDTEFHKRLVYSVDNSVISDTFDSFHYRMSRQTKLSLRSEGRLDQTVREHREILDNMKAGNIGESYMATIKHIGKARTLIIFEEINI